MHPDLSRRSSPATERSPGVRYTARQFSRSVSARHPSHTAAGAPRALGYPDVVAPPTFAMVIQDLPLQQLLAEPDSGVVLERTIHAEQKFRYTRPIVAGDELTGRLSVTGVRAIGQGAMVTSEAEITDASGAHVVTATSILLIGGES